MPARTEHLPVSESLRQTSDLLELSAAGRELERRVAVTDTIQVINDGEALTVQKLNLENIDRLAWEALKRDFRLRDKAPRATTFPFYYDGYY